MRVYSLILLCVMPLSAESYRQVLDAKGEVSTTMIQRIDDNAFIPADTGNRDYAVFLEWQRKGGRIAPPVVQTPEPDPVRDPAKLILLDGTKTERERMAALIIYLGIK